MDLLFDHPHYKWVVLSNTTLGILLAAVNASIVLISCPPSSAASG